MLEFKFSWDKGWLRARVRGELDVASAPLFRERVEQALDAHRTCRLILDLEGLTFIDSSGIGAILGRYRQLSSQRGELQLVGISDRIRPVLEMSGLGRILSLPPVQGGV